MSNFTPLVHKQYEFEGDKISVSFRRLKRKHMISISPMLAKLQSLTDEQGNIPAEAIMDNNEALSDILDAIIDHIPEYVSVFNGLTTADGLEVTVETVADDVYFMPLALQIAMDMVVESSVRAEGNG